MNKTKFISPALALLVIIFVMGFSLLTGVNKAQASTQIPQPDPVFKGEIGRTVQESKPDFPKPITAPEGAPNILLVLLDDVGYGQFGTFGGAIPTPVLDKIASNGIKYTQFHTTALCSPTRAALLTGRNHHSVGTGVIMELGSGFPGYTGILPKEAGTIAQVLQGNGYNTAWFGKNHNVPDWETSSVGPFDRWPRGLGFDYFYGFVGGDANQWEPPLVENTTAIEVPEDKKGTHLTTLLTDKAIEWVRQSKTLSPDKPFFLYFATGATHAPHHVPQEWIDKFKGKFDQGWDEYREETFERQKKLGVIPADAQLTPRPKELPAWDSLTPDQKKLYAHMMEVFAAFTAHTDHEVGRLVEAIDDLEESDNTLIIYIVGDNGSSAEGGLLGLVNELSFFNAVPESLEGNLKALDSLGGPLYYNHFPAAWAWAMNTPFQWTKQVASHFGGIRNPLVISWPAKIKDVGTTRYQFHHVIDVYPTILEATGIKNPTDIKGIPQKPIEGVSLAYTWDKANTDAKSKRQTQYFEMFVNRGIYHDGWIASSIASIPWDPLRKPRDIDSIPWELYHVDKDFSQANNLATQNPAKLKELQDLFWQEAKKYNVLPLDNRGIERLDVANRPSLTAGRTKFTYYPGTIRLPEGNAPDLKNKSYTLTAEVEIPEKGAEGILLTHGGRFAGYGLFLEQGKLVYVHNYVNQARYRVESNQPLAPGKATIEYRFKYEGGYPGSGGTGELYVNGNLVGQGLIEKTIPFRVSLDETFDVGLDTGTPVDESYVAKMPFKFTGKLDKVSIELGKA